MYNPPFNVEEIKKLYPDRVEELLKDSAHLWRADMGIELIHREPSREEQERIWDNWNEMTEEMKKQSDEKSRELFGKDNRSHHAEIMEKYVKKPRQKCLGFLFAFFWFLR